MSRLALVSVLIVVACSCIISVDAQSCTSENRVTCASVGGCGWCNDYATGCTSGGPSGPYGSRSCSCGNWYYNGSYRSCSSASRAWVTAVWVTILVVVTVFCVVWYVRHRRRQLFYQQQAAANQNQATIITTQAGYSSASPVMATAAQPVMATVASPVMAQPVYATGAEGQQPFQQPYQQQPYQGQPQPGYQPAYAPYQTQGQQQQPMYATPAGGYQQPPPGYQPQYAPVAVVEGGVQAQPAYVPAYGAQPAPAAAYGGQPAYMAQPVQGQPASSS